MMEPQHSAILGFGGMVTRAGDDGLRFAKANWQILAVCAAVLVAGGRLSEQMEAMQKTLSSDSLRITNLEGGVIRLETMVGDIRKDQRAGKVGRVER